jgi:hypothetical protein
MRKGTSVRAEKDLRTNGKRGERVAVPASEAAFVAGLNLVAARGDRAIRAADEVRVVLDSLEILLVWAWLDELGAELPPGIEATIVTVHDLYEHAVFRWEAEGVRP